MSRARDISDGKFANDLTVDTNTLHVDAANNRVGIGITSPAKSLSINTSSNTDGIDIGSGGTVLTSITSVGTDTTIQATNAFAVNTNGANERFRIDNSGNFQLGNGAEIGTLSSSHAFTIKGGASNAGGSIRFAGGNGDNDLRFSSNSAEKMRLEANNFILGKTVSSFGTKGARFLLSSSTIGQLELTTDGQDVLNLNRLNSDGSVLRIFQDNSMEGQISVSGTTVSYEGGHLARWSRLTNNSKDTSIVKGTVMTNLDQMVVWHHDAVEAQDAVVDDDGNVVTDAVEAREAYTEDNEQLNCMAVSSVEGDANVAGVFVNWDDGDDFNDMTVAMTGDMVIRIAKGTTVARGDLLMSAGDGTAKPQEDDIVRSKTIAKVTSTNVSHTYDDGSYLVPCVLMAC